MKAEVEQLSGWPWEPADLLVLAGLPHRACGEEDAAVDELRRDGLGSGAAHSHTLTAGKAPLVPQSCAHVLFKADLRTASLPTNHFLVSRSIFGANHHVHRGLFPACTSGLKMTVES